MTAADDSQQFSKNKFGKINFRPHWTSESVKTAISWISVLCRSVPLYRAAIVQCYCSRCCRLNLNNSIKTHLALRDCLRRHRQNTSSGDFHFTCASFTIYSELHNVRCRCHRGRENFYLVLNLSCATPFRFILLLLWLQCTMQICGIQTIITFSSCSLVATNSHNENQHVQTLCPAVCTSLIFGYLQQQQKWLLCVRYLWLHRA